MRCAAHSSQFSKRTAICSALPSLNFSSHRSHSFRPFCPLKFPHLNSSPSLLQRDYIVRSVNRANDGEESVDRSKLFGVMVRFMLPALCIPLSEPAMALIDTIFTGQFAGTEALAGLGPPGIIFSFAQYVFQSLQVAFIGLMGTYLRQDDISGATNIMSAALTLALGAGVLSMVALQLTAPSLISFTGIQDPTISSLSLDYLRLRAFSQPAVLLIMIGQAGLLAQRDSLTPMLTVLLSVGVNLTCNIVFVKTLGFGLSGAAMTTVVTQYAGAFVLIYALMKKGKVPVKLEIPALSYIKELLTCMAPLIITYICKNLCYIVIQVSAAMLTTVKLAAHQAVFSLWNLLAFTSGPIEPTMLSFLPSAKTKRDETSIKQILTIIAIVNSCIIATIVFVVLAYAPHVFTKDAMLWPLMALVKTQAAASLLVSGLDVSSNAILMAIKDMAYVARSYIITLISLSAFMYCSHVYHWGLPGVWWGIMAFFTLRMVQSTGRVWYLNRVKVQF